MRTLWLATLLAITMAACAERDPLADAKEACGNGQSEAEAQIEACTQLIDSGSLDDPTRAIALANRGSALQENGDATGALRDFNTALGLNADNMHAILGRASILIESGQLDAAEPLVERVIASGEYAANANFLAGNIALQRAEPDAAIAAYDRAVAADGRYATALSNRGRAKAMIEDYAGAIADYDAALAINPQLADAYAGRCSARLSRQDADLAAARSDADAAVQANPRDVMGQLCRGVLQLRSGEWVAAQASYDAVLAIEPGNPTALFGRGVARRRSGDNGGRADMNQARDFHPNIAREFEEQGVQTF